MQGKVLPSPKQVLGQRTAPLSSLAGDGTPGRCSLARVPRMKGCEQGPMSLTLSFPRAINPDESGGVNKSFSVSVGF